MKILIIDDDCSLLKQLQQILESQRYAVETATDGEEAFDKLFEATFDLILLDIMMPKIDGLTVLQEIRKAGIKTPVLMLTAKGDVEDKIKGLDLGADDYLPKPFSLDELMARVRALFRRSGGQIESVLQVYDLKLDTVSRDVTKDGKPVELTPREFSILEFLLYNKNRVVSRFSLAEHVWGDAFDPFSMSNFMDVHIKNLRHKVEDFGHSKIIQTIRGVGYIIKDSQQ
ncbi:MAG: response regulator transcription factor [Desulfobacterium sp.]|nr:response regulator transcription factor [Desulfobacterium sp.]MBU3947671.1 response regulator transcription factor [Pseudomonadota bacterium]MBU4010079.1 response regulator transcription factor [Pseudomonadota bacterium]MBU4035040.1 response regulator transcription factor [Pseudomonadota bacterium]